MAFTVRYTAIYYPLVTAITFLLSSQPKFYKLIGIVAPWIAIVPFIIFTRHKTKEITGTAQFSVFGGWQIANNALYMYSHIDVDPNKLPPETIELDRFVKRFHKMAPPGYINLDNFPGTYFIKHSDAPLKQYMHRYAGYTEEIDSTWGFQSWGVVSPLYQRYATYLIGRYPIDYTKYFLALNTKNYLFPYLEKFDSYNSNQDSIWYPAQYWFAYKSNKINCASKKLSKFTFFSYPFIWLSMHLSLLIELIRSMKKRKLLRIKQTPTKSWIFSIGIYIILNTMFSIATTPVVLRYQTIPFFVLFSLTMLFFGMDTDIPSSKLKNKNINIVNL